MARWAGAAVIALVVTVAGASAMPTLPDGDWWSFGRDEGGGRFSPLAEIKPANVARLLPIWTFELKPADSAGTRLLVSNTTPLAVGGTLYLASPYGRVVALDGDSGALRWSFALADGDAIAGRGMDYWPGDARTGARLFFGTRSGRLLALDPLTGRPPAGFTPIDLRTAEVMNGTNGGGYPAGYAYQVNSAPVLYRDVLITGARLQESPAQGPAGDIRGWDARTGRLLWTFHSVPQPSERFHETWGRGWKRRSGVNAWSALSVDAKRGIVYVPFGAPAYDRIGADRPGANLFSSSLVALDARTGRYLWHYQTVHHDIWDLDMPTQPTLMDVRRNGRIIPAVVAMNKSGYLFILDRVTGKPIFPVRETPVPPSSIAGERAWPTQPIPVAPAPLIRQAMTAADLADLTPEHRAFCQARVVDEHATFAVPFEPLRSDHPVIRVPGSGGGPNWGGGAYDRKRGLYIINTSELPSVEQMGQDAQGNWYNVAPQPMWFGMGGTRMPCQRPPWGTLSAVDVREGRIAWQVPLGVTDSLPEALRDTGRPNVGGPLATASGLVFIGASDDARFRAFDAGSGRILWTFRLGASAHATPISYRGRSGRQYVAIISAGGSFLGSANTASRLVAFALPRPGETGVAAAATASQPAVRDAPPPTVAAAPTPGPIVRSGEFAPGSERPFVQQACTACHVAAQVTNQRKSRADWSATVEKMVGFGAQVPDAEFDRVVDYLARNYPAG
ncbi:PQQ-binding-like beta-propeller repeat protein [uncultured Sphingomonas sp.]|uniref:outer membrane protein assembly factor BamB family protein n=1 Tax=uncultured Sphingomonas sp. TaxID=158754 RepID=UPI0025D5B709|nr:PQQ-binding-like beta-propeller repeat protein [uncultured Sphingomonas sp.]